MQHKQQMVFCAVGFFAMGIEYAIAVPCVIIG